MIEVAVARLGLDGPTSSYVVILREKNGRRLLPIWIGKPEAESIAMEMNHQKRDRPLTHDLCKAIIVALGGTLRRVHITRVQKSTYFAEMHIEGNDGWVQLDARPSDSIAIALRFDAPIYADESLLSTLDDDNESEGGTDSFFGVPMQGDLTAEQLKAYLADLQPEDFGKFSP